MAMERTFSIIKPDAVERNKIGEITAMLESAGLRVIASKRIKLDQDINTGRATGPAGGTNV